MAVSLDNKRFSKRAIIALIYAIFFGMILYSRLPLTYISDDSVMIAGHAEMTIAEVIHYHSQLNGRVFIGVLTDLFYRVPMSIWKIVDSFVWVTIAFLIQHLTNSLTPLYSFIICNLLLVFPIRYLASAGYISTSANYVYTFVAFLFAFIPIRAAYDNRKVAVSGVILSVIGILYVSNHDQYMIALLLTMVLMYYVFYLSGKRQNYKIITVELSISIVSYIIYFFSDGHLSRMQSRAEMEYWLPEYEFWSLPYKIYRGYASTCANLLYNDNRLMILLCFLIMLLSLKRQMPLVKKILCGVPFALETAAILVGPEWLIIFENTVRMPEFAPISYKRTIISIVTSLMIIAGVIYAIIILADDHIQRSIIIGALCIGFISRWMMAFSPTIYASSYRTYSLQFFLIMIVCYLLYGCLKKQERKISLSLGVALLLLMVLEQWSPMMEL